MTVNAQVFLDAVVREIDRELARLLVEGVEYEKLPEDLWWEQHRFQDEEGYASRMVQVARSIYDHVQYDSDVEKKIAEQLGKREDIKLFLKLPRWFKVTTPVGMYNPDWAVVKKPADGETVVYMVRESKATDDVEALPDDERRKVKSGAKHFACIGVDYKVVKSADQV